MSLNFYIYHILTVMWRKEAPVSSGHASSLRTPYIIEIKKG